MSHHLGSALRTVLLALLSIGLAACGTVLSGEGPSAESILYQSDAEGPHGEARDFGYNVIRVNSGVIHALNSFEPLSLRRTFGGGSPRVFHPRLDVGDVVQVYIWEAAENGLYSTPENKRTQLPPMQIDKAGRITIPFVGSIRAAGYTPLQLQKRIQKALEGRAISPQVLVEVVRNESNSVIVNGDVRKPGRYQLSLRGSRLLDMIAAAGGSAAPARETMVTLIRKGRRGIQNLKRVIRDPSENIYLRPGDQIYLSHKPQTFTAFGAVSKKGEYSFDSDRVNVLEAVARAGGLLDERANASGVFLFRLESNAALKKLGVPPEKLDATGFSPTVYVIDMRDPRAYFLAQGFMMRDNDVIYVANSVATELHKFLRLINAGTSAVRGTYSAATIGN